MIFLITAAFIGLDFISGLIKACATHTFMSSKMREGLFHKVGFMLCVVLGVLVDNAQAYIDLGISIPVPVTGAVCAYIILMEMASILENVCIIVPELVPEKLHRIFYGSDMNDGNG